MLWAAPQSLSDRFGGFLSQDHSLIAQWQPSALALCPTEAGRSLGAAICVACLGCFVLNLLFGTLPQGHFYKKPPTLPLDIRA